MKKYKRAYVKAKKVMCDDYFKVAGLLYRVSRVIRFDDDVEISAYLVGSNTETITLLIPKRTITKIWNQA